MLVSLMFALALAGEASAAAPATDYVTTPVWLKRATGQEMASFYPSDGDGASGGATVECTVQPDGRLDDCVANEVLGPQSVDFGKAARRVVMKTFRMAPQDKTGAATAGRKVRVPVSWNFPSKPGQ